MLFLPRVSSSITLQMVRKIPARGFSVSQTEEVRILTSITPINHDQELGEAAAADGDLTENAHHEASGNTGRAEESLARGV